MSHPPQTWLRFGPMVKCTLLKEFLQTGTTPEMKLRQSVIDLEVVLKCFPEATWEPRQSATNLEFALRYFTATAWGASTK